MRQLDVLIVTHRAGSLLQECIEAVQAQSQKAARVVVVVNLKSEV